MEAASRETFSQTVIDMHQGTKDLDKVPVDGDTQMLELANGSGAVVADQEMSRDEMLDRVHWRLEIQCSWKHLVNLTWKRWIARSNAARMLQVAQEM